MTTIRCGFYRITTVALAAVAVSLAGCGGGGGSTGGPTPPDGGNTALTITVQSPDLTGKTDQQLLLPVKVSGTGSVESARADIRFAEGAFEPVSGTATVGGPAVELAGLPDDTACLYKWINSRTIRVIYASADASASGSVLVSIPVKVKVESSAGIVVQNVTVNH